MGRLQYTVAVQSVLFWGWLFRIKINDYIYLQIYTGLLVAICSMLCHLEEGNVSVISEQAVLQADVTSGSYDIIALNSGGTTEVSF